MDLSIQRRAEITLRALSRPERDKVLSKLKVLANRGSTHRNKIKKLKSTNLYAYRAGHLRIILSKDNGGWVVEDIMDHDKYDRLHLEASPAETV